MIEKKEKSRRNKLKTPHATNFAYETTRLKMLSMVDYELAYKRLKECMDKGEPWAFQLYFREVLPARMKEDSVYIPTPETNNIEEYLKTLSESLMSFSHYTKAELVAIVKAFSGIKHAQTEERKVNVFANLPDEYISSLVDIIKSNDNSNKQNDGE